MRTVLEQMEYIQQQERMETKTIPASCPEETRKEYLMIFERNLGVKITMKRHRTMAWLSTDALIEITFVKMPFLWRMWNLFKKVWYVFCKVHFDLQCFTTFLGKLKLLKKRCVTHQRSESILKHPHNSLLEKGSLGSIWTSILWATTTVHMSVKQKFLTARTTNGIFKLWAVIAAESFFFDENAEGMLVEKKIVLLVRCLRLCFILMNERRNTQNRDNACNSCDVYLNNTLIYIN